MVRIDVADTGVGLSEEVKSKLFQPCSTDGRWSIDFTFDRRSALWKNMGATQPRRRDYLKLYLALGYSGDPSMIEEPVIHIIDDDPAVCDSLRALLVAEGFHVQTYASALKFLEYAGRHASGCVVTDVRMPDMSGIDLLAKMKERRLALPAVVITGHADIPLAVQAMKQGAVDLLEKPFDDEALLASVSQALIKKSREQAGDAQSQEILERLKTLTERENSVLTGLLMGKPNKVIAYELDVSARTVEVHRANVMAKMKAGSLAELVRMSLAVPRAERI
jgi:two-component system response regulator FixJ